MYKEFESFNRRKSFIESIEDEAKYLTDDDIDDIKSDIEEIKKRFRVYSSAFVHRAGTLQELKYFFSKAMDLILDYSIDVYMLSTLLSKDDKTVKEHYNTLTGLIDGVAFGKRERHNVLTSGYILHFMRMISHNISDSKKVYIDDYTDPGRTFIRVDKVDSENNDDIKRIDPFGEEEWNEVG